MLYPNFKETQCPIFESISSCFTECSASHPCQGLGPHAHFGDFGTAMLTLFRIATGDNWNGILEVKIYERYMEMSTPQIGHFTVMCPVSWPLNASEAGVDLALIQTSLLSHPNAN